MVGVSPPLLNLHQLCLQGGLSSGVSRQEQTPAGLHGEDVAPLLPVENPLPQLEEHREGERKMMRLTMGAYML